jgi:hypothetical protein
MANRFWVGGGTGNYNSTTNWSATSGGASGASVPTTVDAIFFNASSGSGAVNINVNSNCLSINLTGFAGSFVFANNLSVVGTSLVFNVGSYTVTGAGFLIFANSNAVFSITSNSTVWGGNLRLGNASPTVNLVDNLSVAGNLVLTSSGVLTLNSNNITVGGGLSILGSSVILGTSNIILNGTGTWSNTSTTAIRNNLTINTSGTLTIGTNVYYNTGTLTYTAGTVVTAGSTLNINGNTTLTTNGIVWNNITAAGALTLGSNLTLTGTLSKPSSSNLSFALGGNSLISTNANLTMNSGTFTLPANQTFKSLTTQLGACTLNGNTLTLTENIVMNQNLLGTTNIIYAGTGTWTASSVAFIINNNFTINTAGTLTISGTVYKASNTFTYTAGTIVDTGATVVVGGSSATTCNIAGKTWNKLLIGGAITLTSSINAVTFGTTGNVAISFTLGGNTLNFTHLELGGLNTTTLPFAWVCQNLTFSLASSGVINGHSITINGDILQSGNGSLIGTTAFIYGGTGTWSRTGTTYFSNPFTINTSGTLTFSGGSIGGGIFTYTAGTVNVQTGSILTIRVTGTTMNHGAIVWYDVILGSSLGVGSVGTLILNNKLTCSNSLILGLSNTVFSGTDGTFDTYDLYFGSPLSSSQTTRLVATKTYTVRRLVQCTQAPSTFPLILNSTVAGTRAIFTVLKGSTINIGFLNVTDINSSLGKKLYSYRGVISNSLNWAQLPTDVKPTTSIFVN